MRVIRKPCEHGERLDKEEVVSNGSWKEASEVQDDCIIQKERLYKANDTHWEVYTTTQLLTSQLALMMKTVTTTTMKYIKRRMDQ